MKKFLLLFIVFNLLFSKTIVVDDDYSTGLDYDYSTGWLGHDTCEDGDDKYNNIQDAVDDAESGDLIKICAGKYDENVTYQNGNIDELNITKASDVKKPTDVNWTNDDRTFTVEDKINNLYISGIYMYSKNKTVLTIKQSINNLTLDGVVLDAEKKYDVDIQEGIQDTLEIKGSKLNAADTNIDTNETIDKIYLKNSNFYTSGGSNNLYLKDEVTNTFNIYSSTFTNDKTNAHNIYAKKDIKADIDIENSDFTSSYACLLYTSPSTRDRTRSRMPSSA
jgi:hypothetical protein